MIERAVRTLLKNDATIAGKVGTRIRMVHLREKDTLPAIILHHIDGDHIEDSEGGSGFCLARIQIDCVDDSYEDTETLRDNVRTIMQDPDSPGTVGSDTVQAIEHFGDIPVRGDQQSSGAENWKYTLGADYGVWHTETIPT